MDANPNPLREQVLPLNVVDGWASLPDDPLPTVPIEADDDATILDISGDAGFASLGPFNRAFKAATGCTPTAYRAAHRTTPGAVDMLQTDARS